MMKTIIQTLIAAGVVFLGIGVGTGIILMFLDLIDFFNTKNSEQK